LVVVFPIHGDAIGFPTDLCFVDDGGHLIVMHQGGSRYMAAFAPGRWSHFLVNGAMDEIHDDEDEETIN
jgi:hypothetical protein